MAYMLKRDGTVPGGKHRTSCVGSVVLFAVHFFSIAPSLQLKDGWAFARRAFPPGITYQSRKRERARERERDRERERERPGITSQSGMYANHQDSFVRHCCLGAGSGGRFAGGVMRPVSTPSLYKTSHCCKSFVATAPSSTMPRLSCGGTAYAPAIWRAAKVAGDSVPPRCNVERSGGLK